MLSKVTFALLITIFSTPTFTMQLRNKRILPQLCVAKKAKKPNLRKFHNKDICHLDVAHMEELPDAFDQRSHIVRIDGHDFWLIVS